MTERLSLTQDGVEMVEYPSNIKQCVAKAAIAWQDFLAQPDDTKQRYAALSLQSGTGYEKKGDGQRESKDIKENFDVTRASLEDLIAISMHDPATAQFAIAARALFDELEQFIAAQGAHIEQHYGTNGFAAEAAASAASAFVRFLHYPPVAVGTVIGEPHVDHSGLTLHLYESTDGCERLDPSTRMWLPMPVSDDQAVMFASMQTQLYSKGEIKGLCHQIIANNTTAKLGRNAIVCFVPLVRTPRYDRAAYGRLQERTPGFNYDMPRTEFAQYFAA